MAKDQRNFTRGRMNKELDKRLIPNGEYIDALNIGVNSTEEDESGVVENSIGNLQVTALSYNGTSLSNDALCIGALEDGSNETLYWFVHDPSFTPSAATGKLDLIVSYSTELALITYHIVSINDGGGSNTTLNFNPSYLITGVDKVDDFLFFTDDYNAPRFINITKTYTVPTTVDQFIDEEIIVVKKPPTQAPIVTMSSNANVSSNFLEDRYICFAYRYRYDDNMYSATSQFTKPAFAPKIFDFTTESYLNDGMLNKNNRIQVEFEVGGPLVKGIDILFKEAGSSTIKVIEKLDREDIGSGNNFIIFIDSKIFTVLPESEILRLYDNVPRLSKAQTIMGNRLMYGNYLEGYPLTDLNGNDTLLTYIVSRQETNFEVQEIDMLGIGSSDYTINPIASPTAIPNSLINFNLEGIATNDDGTSALIAGSEIEFSFTFEHHSFNVDGAGPPIAPAQTNWPSVDPIDFTATFILSSSYNSVADYYNSTEFSNAVGTLSNINPLFSASDPTSCDGATITDQYNCIALSTLGAYSIYTSGITSASTAVNPEPIKVVSYVTGQMMFQFPAYHYVDDTAVPTQHVYEYMTCTSASGLFLKAGNAESLHSNRGYELALVYMDEYSRSTNGLVSPQNTLYFPCSSSRTKNKIRVEIPTTQIAPSWAKRYKFVIKPDRDGYNTVYSNFFFSRGVKVWLLLQGENARKVNEGDRLIVKRDGGGPTTSCLYVTVLEKLTLSSSQAEEETGESSAPSGVYIVVNSGDLDLTEEPNSFLDFPQKSASAEYADWYPYVFQPLNQYPNTQDFTIPAGSIIKFRFEFSREGRTETSSCQKRHYTIDKQWTSSQNYDTILEWFEEEDIQTALNQGVQDQAEDDDPPTFFVSGTTGSQAWQTNSGAEQEQYILGTTGISPSVAGYGFKFEYTFAGAGTNGLLHLVMTGTRACGQNQKRHATIKSKCSVRRALNLFVFETIPEDSVPDLFYEADQSFGIDANGNHEGNITNQDIAAGVAAIIDTSFFNCYSFGNGVESYRIRDSIEGKTFALGNRATSTQGKDYEEVRRFADITYSGVYNQESNVNKLNEFNLGLLNFKPLEQSYGNISKLHAIQTDVLCLQEDKVSYVLSGKNLLSDAVGGGAVTSVPEVLGQQIARSEDFGISHNPESFAEFGPNIFFTDAKRGAVIQLRGSAAGNLNLSVISDAGMSPWFRDLFQVSFDYQKLGGYDPYAEEYVLSSNTRKLPSDTSCIPCGTIQTYVISAGETATYCVNVGPIAENFDIDYSFIGGGTADIQAIFNGLPFSTGVTGVDGSLTVTKTGSHIETVDISLVATTDVTLQVLVNCPVGEELTIVQVCVTSQEDSDALIHNAFGFSQGGYISPQESNQVSFSSALSNPLVSQYQMFTGFQGEGIFPSDGSSVSIISNKYLTSDTYVWETNDTLRYLRSGTLYANTAFDISALLASSIDVTPIGAASPIVTGTFTMPPVGDYLYLIYDYRDNSSVRLCYWAAAPTDCCCPSGTLYYIDSSNFSTATGIYTNIGLTAQAVDGWYSDGVVMRSQTSGLLSTTEECELCAIDCGEPAIEASRVGKGKYTIEFELTAAVGAIIIKYTPNKIPNGIRATYDGVNYNRLSSPVYGEIQSSVPSNNFTVCGTTDSDCGDIVDTEWYLKYQYDGALSQFQYQDSQESITIAAGDVQIKTLSSGECVMVIPKTGALQPTLLSVDILGVCDQSSFDVSIECPALITSKITSAVVGTSGAACLAPLTSQHYTVKVAAGSGIEVHDYVFTDANGTTPAAAGITGFIQYAGDWFEIDDGIVIATGNCP